MSQPTSTPYNPAEAYRSIYQQYMDDASFLWLLRAMAIHQPHYNKSEIGDLEVRIQANLDGLMSSIDIGWQACVAGLEFEEAGEVFSAAVTAFRSHEVGKIKQVVDIAVTNEEAVKGFISAMGWLPERLVTPWIEKFLVSKDLDHKYLGIAACSVRRHDPGELLTTILNREDCLSQPRLYSRALRLVGELRRQDLMPTISHAVQSEEPEVLFWASWSGVLLGNRMLANNLTSHLLNESEYSELSVNMLFRILPIDQARQWITAMAADEKLNRLVLKATGVLGDPHAVNWLIQKMREPHSARLAGEAFSQITGINLGPNNLVLEQPMKHDSGPNDDPEDDNVQMDEDENLPWPDADKVALLWQQQGRNFIIGQRYFLGRQINSSWLLVCLEQANQRQRHGAALELALTDPTHGLYNVQGRVSGS